MTSFWPLLAAPSTELAVAGEVSYLAFWRLVAVVTSLLSAPPSGPPESAWERIVRLVAPGQAYLYVPAFSLTRPVVQMLGVSLTMAQPVLELSRGAKADAGWQPSVVPAAIRLVGRPLFGEESLEAVGQAPDLGQFSPVVVGRHDARTLAHFVYLALESHEVHDLQRVDYELCVGTEELVFIPAVWDPRYIREANWRLLLKEFDGLVA